ncbi:MAG: hypothetical protein JRE20_03360 [Deltaproteobacteria bacterium]|nr:hypothetical protein [Deltaproteobacteria bacterium]
MGFGDLGIKVQLHALMKLLTILDSRLRGNDMFFQSLPSLFVIPAKLVIYSDRGAVIQDLASRIQYLNRYFCALTTLFVPERSLMSSTLL